MKGDAFIHIGYDEVLVDLTPGDYLVFTNEGEWGDKPWHLYKAHTLEWMTKRISPGYRGRPLAYALCVAPPRPPRVAQRVPHTQKKPAKRKLKVAA